MRHELTVHTFSYIAATLALALNPCKEDFTVFVEVLKVVTVRSASRSKQSRGKSNSFELDFSSFIISRMLPSTDVEETHLRFCSASSDSSSLILFMRLDSDLFLLARGFLMYSSARSLSSSSTYMPVTNSEVRFAAQANTTILLKGLCSTCLNLVLSHSCHSGWCSSFESRPDNRYQVGEFMTWYACH